MDMSPSQTDMFKILFDFNWSKQILPLCGCQLWDTNSDFKNDIFVIYLTKEILVDKPLADVKLSSVSNQCMSEIYEIWSIYENLDRYFINVQLPMLQETWMGTKESTQLLLGTELNSLSKLFFVIDILFWHFFSMVMVKFLQSVKIYHYSCK